MQDKDIDLLYILPRDRLVDRDKLRVNLSAKFNRRHLPDKYERQIDIIWGEKLKANPTLWNGTKFRLDSITSQEGVVAFNIGITCYKDFIGTNWSPEIKTLHQLGLQEFTTSQAYLSDALGVGALVITSDDKIILMRRSHHCGEAVGLLDIPGGHPEPKKIVGKIPMESIDIEKINKDDVVNEIFNSTLEEIINEVNIPNEHLSDPLLLGVARNTTSGGRPSSEYLVNCSLSSLEVEELYKSGMQSEADETIGIHFYDLKDIPKMQQLHQTIWNDLAPSAKGCIMLYQNAFSA